MLFPSYRNRFLFVKRQLKRGPKAKYKILHLGCGEGDYDPHLLPFASSILAGDINEGDISYAKSVNGQLSGLEYKVLDALDLAAEDGSFDIVIAVDTLEHVDEPQQMMHEIARVLKKGGRAFLTFPRYEFPITYDPINFFNQIWNRKPIAQGAYAFNHTFLVKNQDWRTWCQKAGLVVEQSQKISGWLIALIEMYWTGWIQKIFKANSANKSNQNEKWAVRSDAKTPVLVLLTDLLIGIDAALNVISKRSIGMGLIIRKKESV